jgi:molybdopterin/thiamine biosynthesis adenylyltransferase
MAETPALLLRPKRIVFIGVGGIGSWLVEPVLRYFYTVCSNVLFVDGDFVEGKNLARQSFTRGEVRAGKAASICMRMRVMFPNHTLNGSGTFVRANNVAAYVAEGDLVLLSPDNHEVRRIVSDEAMKRRDIVVITSGNELYDGSCHAYVKARGIELSRDFKTRHPKEVDLPGERAGCAELIDKGAVQLIAVNFMIAAMALMTVQHIYSYGIYRTKNEFWEDVPQELYGDIRRLKMGAIMAGKPTKVNRQRLVKEGVCSS